MVFNTMTLSKYDNTILTVFLRQWMSVSPACIPHLNSLTNSISVSNFLATLYSRNTKAIKSIGNVIKCHPQYCERLFELIDENGHNEEFGIEPGYFNKWMSMSTGNKYGKLASEYIPSLTFLDDPIFVGKLNKLTEYNNIFEEWSTCFPDGVVWRAYYMNNNNLFVDGIIMCLMYQPSAMQSLYSYITLRVDADRPMIAIQLLNLIDELGLSAFIGN